MHDGWTEKEREEERKEKEIEKVTPHGLGWEPEKAAAYSSNAPPD